MSGVEGTGLHLQGLGSQGRAFDEVSAIATHPHRGRDAGT